MNPCGVGGEQSEFRPRSHGPRVGAEDGFEHSRGEPEALVREIAPRAIVTEVPQGLDTVPVPHRATKWLFFPQRNRFPQSPAVDTCLRYKSPQRARNAEPQRNRAGVERTQMLRQRSAGTTAQDDPVLSLIFIRNIPNKLQSIQMGEALAGEVTLWWQSAA